MDYGGGLENRFRLWRTWVRIPPPPPSGRRLANDGERLFTPDESGNYKSSLAIVIITFLLSTRSLVRECKLANESLLLTVVEKKKVVDKDTVIGAAADAFEEV